MLLQTLTIVAPVFLLIGTGYAFAKFKVLSESVGEALGQFVFIVAVPVLIFRTLINADLSGGLPLSLWASYFLGIGIVWALGILVIRKVFDRDATSGAIGGISASFSNLVLIGMPLMSAVFGEEGLVPILLIISVHLASMTIVMSVAMESAAASDSGKERPPFGKMIGGAVRSLATNPIVLAIVSAFLWRFSGFELPFIIQDILSRISATALPLALLSLGMSLVQYGMRGNILPGLLLAVMKIAIMPAIVFTASAFVFNLPPLWAAVATLCAACPTGVNAYLFANRYGTGHAMSANAITITTLCAIGTTSLWILFLKNWFGLG